jgi:hypothetical protein
MFSTDILEHKIHRRLAELIKQSLIIVDEIEQSPRIIENATSYIYQSLVRHF